MTDAVEKVGGFRLGWAFDAVGLMCGWATVGFGAI
jgi:hypothetical protein